MPLGFPGVAAGAGRGGAGLSRVRLTTLSPEQAAYIGVPVEGPFKPDHYRY